MSTKFHQPTVKEAVNWMLQSSLEYRRLCLKHWREHFGDAYTDEVQKQFLIKWRSNN